MNNLSKSKYITFCQCPKALWLKMYKPEEIEIDPLTQARFDAGTEVGNLAKSLFGEYTEATVCKMTADGSQRPDLQAMIAATQKLIADGTDNIAEAAFIYDGCYCAVDLLHKTPQGYAIYEVKSSTDLKELEVYAQDVAYQKYVLTNCGLTITGTYLVNIDNEYVLDGKLDVKGFFRINDISEAVANEYILKSATYRVSWEFTCKTTKILLLYIFLGHNRNVVNTKFPYPIKRLEVIRRFNQKSMAFNQSLS